MSLMPSGTVTFLFTDIEGSTRKWQNWPHKMKRALKQHDEILRQTIEEHNGYVFKTVGDAFCAAFQTAMDCINGALASQIKINEADWNLPEEFRVRMAVHTGEAVERNKDYYGPAVNRVARLESLAWGGQVLLSLVTAELIRDMMPEPMDLIDLGMHRLKDLIRPEGVYQLSHPGLPFEFPPVKSLDSHPHNLSILPSPLIGREDELRIIEDKLMSGSARILSIIGPGGMGKTRISQQAAVDIIESFRNGVYFVDLTKIEKEEDLYPLVNSTLSVRESEDRPSGDVLKEHLKDKQTLLILDNFEHIMKGAKKVADLLSYCPQLQILVTSREAIHIRGESVFHLPPLGIPQGKTDSKGLIRKLNQYDSLKLFIERAQGVDEDFTINESNAPAIAQICVDLDGIPLAIELAAARITALSPDAILDKMNHSLDLLTQGAADLPDRQHTLRSTIKWSYDLLDPQQRDLFSCLSVFPGGFDLFLAEAVSSLEGISVLDGIEHLLEKSLLVKDVKNQGESRFHMLETIREFASEQFELREDKKSILERAAGAMLNLVEASASAIEGAQQKECLDSISINHENILKAIDYYNTCDVTMKAVRIVSRMLVYWGITGRIETGKHYYNTIQIQSDKKEYSGIEIDYQFGRLLLKSLEWKRAEELFAELQGIQDLTETHKLLISYSRAWCHYRLKSYDAAYNSFENVHLSAAESGNIRLKARALYGMGTVSWKLKSIDKAKEYLTDALSILNETGDIRSLGQASANLGIIHFQQGDYQKAETLFARASKAFLEIGEKAEARNVLNNMAFLNFEMGKYQKSAKYYRELIENSLGDSFYTGMAFSGLASSLLKTGKIKQAEHYCNKALSVLDRRELAGDHAIALRILGDIKVSQADPAGARELYTQAIPILKEAGEDDDLALAEKALEELSSTI